MRFCDAVLALAVAATIRLYAGIAPPIPVSPDGPASLPGGIVCRELVSADGKLPEPSLASASPQPEVKGCCVLKDGPQSGWRYIFTTAGNCTRLARNAECPHSFYPNTQCERLRPR